MTKKGRWFFVTLRGGRGGVRASVTFVTKKMFFFLKASLSIMALNFKFINGKFIIERLIQSRTHTHTISSKIRLDIINSR